MNSAQIRSTLLALAVLGAIAHAQEKPTAPAPAPAEKAPTKKAPPAPQSVSPRDAEPWTPGDFKSVHPALPTLIIAGDSTADKGPDAWHRGWAALLVDYFDTTKINVVNRDRRAPTERTADRRRHEQIQVKILGVRPEAFDQTQHAAFAHPL